MKKVISGNEAYARGAFEAGVGFVSSYPGTPSTEITEYISKYDEIYSEWAINEKVATEAALGASIAGKRSMTCMKHVGLNLASEPLMTGSYTGVNAGMVIIVADDPSMHSSQNEQDSRNFARFAKVPMLEPSDSQEAKEYIKIAFDISEKFSVPVLVRSETRISHSMSVVSIDEPKETISLSFEKDTEKWVMVPVNARKRHRIVEERLKCLQNISGQLSKIDDGEGNYGVICSGVTYQYVREALPDAKVFKLGMVWPLPINEIQNFSQTVNKLYVVEELDTIFETELKAAGIYVEPLERDVCGELSQDTVSQLFNANYKKIEENKIKLPIRPPNLCPGCSHRGIFYAISKLKLFSFGDIGCYTLGMLPPLSAINTTVCMGASVSMAHGADKASMGEVAKKSVAVIGDSTFLHTGVPALINSVYNKGASTVVLLDNRITGMTGHQPNPASGFTIKGEVAPAINFVEMCKASGVKNIRVVDPFDVDECIKVLKEEVAKDEVSVIITNKPCIFADKSVILPSLVIKKNKCTGCTICTKLGCPAIHWDKYSRKASIDMSMCTGCDLCIKVCRFSAIIKQEGANNG